MLTNIEMVKFQKWDFFSIFLYTFTINCATMGARKIPIEYLFCFICSKQCMKIILSRKKCGVFGSVIKKIIPNNTTPTFQEVGGVTKPLTFCPVGNHHEIDRFLLSKVFLLFSLPMFTIEMNQNVNL